MPAKSGASIVWPWYSKSFNGKTTGPFPEIIGRKYGILDKKRISVKVGLVLEIGDGVAR
jgi:hypothetical protein